MHPNKTIPLFVDLDGTVLKSDLLFESVLWLLRHRPWILLLAPFWLLRGRARLKFEVANHAQPIIESQPRNPEFEAFLRCEADRGRDLILISASDQRLTRLVAAHFGHFVDAMGSDEHTNLKGQNKLLRIRHLCGDGAFGYAGDSAPDLIIWQQAEQRITVNASKTIRAQLDAQDQTGRETLHFDVPSSYMKAFYRALRPHQWLKNSLLFLPLLLSHQADDLSLLFAACVGFMSFSLCSSSVYLLNDMLDLESDRQHVSKHKRPFASGELSLRVGFVAAPLLLFASLVIATALPSVFVFTLAAYWTTTLLYSLYIKAYFLIDALVLAGLFTLRIVAGSAAIGVTTTDWLLAFSLFLFFGLALVKRHAELMNLESAGKLTSAGRGYHVSHLALIRRLGLAANLAAIGVFAFYALAPSTTQLYSEPLILLGVCPPMIYLALRLWRIARAGELQEDPVRFAMQDRHSQFLLGCCALIIWFAI